MNFLVDNILFYLIHYKEDSKYHYNFDDLVGSSMLKSKLKKIINNFERDLTIEHNQLYNNYEKGE